MQKYILKNLYTNQYWTLDYNGSWEIEITRAHIFDDRESAQRIINLFETGVGLYEIVTVYQPD